MKKIAAVSMVYNEADIIEAFVRHTLTFADRLYITDHMSTDATGKIINALMKEGLPILLDVCRDSGHIQAEVITGLMEQAVEDGYSLVLPLDADEFLLPDDYSQNVKDLLFNLSAEKIYHVKMFAYRFPEETSVFSLEGQCLRSKEEKGFPKCIIGGVAEKNRPLRIVQGNHLAMFKAIEGKNTPPEHLAVEGLHLAHFAYRSKEQQMSKYTMCWLRTVAKYTLCTEIAFHHAKQFRHILSHGETQTDEPGEFFPVKIPSALEQRPVYHSLVEHNYLAKLLLVAEKLANDLAEERFLRKQKLVSCVIVFDNPMCDFIKSFESAYRADYPYKEYIVLFWPGNGEDELTKLTEYLEQYSADADITLLAYDTTDELLFALKDSAKGDYVQWLFPGFTVSADKFRLVGAAQETRDMEWNFVCYADEETSGEVAEAVRAYSKYGIFTGSGKNFMGLLFDCKVHPIYALTLPLFTGSDMKFFSYLRDTFVDGVFNPFTLWQNIFGDHNILCIAKPRTEDERSGENVTSLG